MDDFYEDDESIEEVVEAFEEGEKQETEPPRKRCHCSAGPGWCRCE